MERPSDACTRRRGILEEHAAAKAITLRQIQDADQRISEAEKKIADSATPQPVCTAIRSAAKTLTNSSSTLEQKCEAIHSI